MIDKENESTTKNPGKLLGYVSIVFLGVLVNLTLMIMSFIIVRPSMFSAQTNDLFFALILFVIPLLGSFVYCLFSSLRTPNRLVISPIFVVLFTMIPTLIVGGYVMYSLNFFFPGAFNNISIIGYIFIVLLINLFLIFVASVVMHPIIRSFVGAYAERDNLKSGTQFYRIANINSVLEKMEDQRWLSDLCSMEVVNRKEKKDEICLRFSKYRTPFFITLFAKRTKVSNLLSLTGYELEENIVEKNIFVSDSSKYSLEPQTKEIERALKLEPASPESVDDILYEALNYAMSPAKFPILIQYKNQFLIAAITGILSSIVVAAFFANMLDSRTAVAIIAIIISLGTSAFNFLRRK